MTVVKRVIIFLLVAVGIFTTVEFINFKIEDAHHWGVHMDFRSSKDTTAAHTASTKPSTVQAQQKTKSPAAAG